MLILKKLVIAFVILVIFFFFPPCALESASDITENGNNKIGESYGAEEITDFGEHYKVVDISGGKDTFSGYHETNYRYDIYNNKSELVKSENILRVYPFIGYIEDTLLKIEISPGTNITLVQYYDIERDIFSEIFQSPLLEENRRVVYLEFTDLHDFVLVVRDIFEKDIFFAEINLIDLDISPVVSPIISVEFIDEYTLNITYISGEMYEEKTAILDIKGS